MKKIILAIASISFFACANSKKSTREKTLNETEVVAKNYQFTVSFISIGSGTDANARNSFDKFVTNFEQKNNTKLAFVKVQWGREGEMDYCFDMNIMSLPQQEKFIAESKALLKNSKLVRYERNAICREGRK